MLFLLSLLLPSQVLWQPTSISRLSIMATAQSQSSQVTSSVRNEPFLSFSLNEKRYIVFLIASAGWFSTLSSFIYYPVISLVAKDLHTTIANINLTVTTYLAISSVAPAFVGDAADMLGRRPLYVLTRPISTLRFLLYYNSWLDSVCNCASM